MPTSDLQSPKRIWTAAGPSSPPARSTRCCPRAAAALAEADYKTDPQLTAFDAFGDGDFMATVPAPPISRVKSGFVNFDPASGAELQKLRPAL